MPSVKLHVCDKSAQLCFIPGPVYSTERVWISPEERNCWFGTMTPTPPSSASRCSASLRMKTVREYCSFIQNVNVRVTSPRSENEPHCSAQHMVCLQGKKIDRKKSSFLWMGL